MWQSLPRFALPRTKANGTAFLLQRAGKCTITSMGSTSWEMTTNLALPSSTRVVTWLRPNLMWTGLAVLPAPPFSAAVLRRSFFSCLVSGVYFERSLKRVEAEIIRLACYKLTLVLVNCLRELVNGGWNLESLHENTLLSLNANILWPLDETGQISYGLDVTTNTEVFGGLLEKGCSSILLFGVSNNDFLSLYSFLYLILNHRWATVFLIRVNKSVSQKWQLRVRK